jgi:hypothetical protein
MTTQKQYLKALSVIKDYENKLNVCDAGKALIFFQNQYEKNQNIIDNTRDVMLISEALRNKEIIQKSISLIYEYINKSKNKINGKQ